MQGKKHNAKDKIYDNVNEVEMDVVCSNSVTTIYRDVVEPEIILKRKSTSSEDEIDTSDELINLEDQFKIGNVVEHRSHEDRNWERSRSVHDRDREIDRWRGVEAPSYEDRREREDSVRITERKAEDLIRAAEAAKTRIAAVPGRLEYNSQLPIEVRGTHVNTAMIDENFQLVVAHVDQNIKKKIEMGEYIDFALLLP